MSGKDLYKLWCKPLEFTTIPWDSLQEHEKILWDKLARELDKILE